jgi:hypothetical protein
MDVPAGKPLQSAVSASLFCRCFFRTRKSGLTIRPCRGSTEMRNMALVSEEVDLAPNNSNAGWRRRLVNVATDPHFWLPTLVLAAGLMLLRWVR